MAEGNELSYMGIDFLVRRLGQLKVGMLKWKKAHTTPHVCVPITNPRRNIPSDHDQQARYRLPCRVLDSFHSEIQGPVFLSVEPDAKLDMLKTFDLDKPFNLHLDPPFSENPPLCKITQNGKDLIITTDFYLTNMEPPPYPTDK